MEADQKVRTLFHRASQPPVQLKFKPSCHGDSSKPRMTLAR